MVKNYTHIKNLDIFRAILQFNNESLTISLITFACIFKCEKVFFAERIFVFGLVSINTTINHRHNLVINLRLLDLIKGSHE